MKQLRQLIENEQYNKSDKYEDACYVVDVSDIEQLIKELDDYVLVPREPTKEKIDVLKQLRDHSWNYAASDAWAVHAYYSLIESQGVE